LRDDFHQTKTILQDFKKLVILKSSFGNFIFPKSSVAVDVKMDHLSLDITSCKLLSLLFGR